MSGGDIRLSVLFLAVWIPRLLLGSKGSKHDLILLCVFLLPYARQLLHMVPSHAVSAFIALALSAAVVSIWSSLCLNRGSDLAPESKENAESKGPFEPLIFPCRTSHTRLFPQKHAFSYSYLTVGVPVGWQGRAGSMIETEGRRSDPGEKRALSIAFRVEAADHLDRGNDHISLRGKLDTYIKSQVCTAIGEFIWCSYTLERNA